MANINFGMSAGEWKLLVEALDREAEKLNTVAAAVRRGESEYGLFSYPKTTEQAALELKGRGYDVDVVGLNYLIKIGEVKLDQPKRKGKKRANLKWTPDNIQQAADWLERKGRYVRTLQVCSFYGVTYNEYNKALREAYDIAVREYGDESRMVLSVRPNPGHFVTTYYPKLGDAPGRVEFTLAQEIGHIISKLKRKKK